ncbi:hypothetical protein CANCADRAFT_30580 [Tortispora caseinolytica NRRL Y-17796]|uniref:Cyclase n=1 Tax=Tortispora caseinolytica NRRL Y-17796 TaxID=767744 RepID=A0A1E4TKY6_9ASCO|nr:hypothetical protein CANCADRAFT_30580 [Tortispora caseinolytica NRRL Y-17796]
MDFDLKFHELPIKEGLPEGCAWGVFDRDGQKDSKGTLNFVTPEITKAACSTVKLGLSVSLDWKLDAMDKPAFNRMVFHQEIIDRCTPGVHAGFDDVLCINTQSSSQWDGLCHWGHGKAGLFYNGVTREQIKSKNMPLNISMSNWGDNGGLVTRGVLIDYVAYAQKHGIKYSPVDRHEITLDEMKECAYEQGVVFQPGDVLIVRTGFVDWYQYATPEDRTRLVINRGRYAGIIAGKETAAWIWNNKFVAVASDAPTVEAWPPKHRDHNALHFFCISMFGMSLGELWDLRDLAHTCAKLQRYTFLLTSAPLRANVLIASPPNALAIF